MSFQAMTWAVDQKCGSAAAKLVLLMLANYCNGHTGQCNPSHKRLAAECDMTVETLKTHLKKLESLGLIDIVAQFMGDVQLPNQYLVKVGGGGGKNSGEGGGNISPGGGVKNSPPNNQEENQEGNREPFDLFWHAYPKKKDKESARKAWAKVSTGLHETIFAAVAKQSQSRDWTKDDGQFVPLASTWLNGKRWEDEDGDSGVDTRTRDIWAGAV